MMKILVVGCGGFLGAVARYAISGWVQARTDSDFPSGTLAVNVLGCLLLGALMSFAETRSALSPEARMFVAIGILGSFTTFSTFGYETLELLRSGALRLTMLSIMANLLVGVAAVWAGRIGVRWLFG